MTKDFDEIVGAEPTGAERERLRHAHELLLQAGPPPELTPQLRAGPNLGMVRRKQRRVVRRRAVVLLAAALCVVTVFVAGYAVARVGGGGKSSGALEALELKGTAVVPNARATLELWPAKSGNWPMTLSVVGLPKLPPHTFYEVYLVRGGKRWGSCGTFRVASSSRVVTLTLNAPYSLRRGDFWIVTRQAPGSEPGRTVLRPVSA